MSAVDDAARLVKRVEAWVADYSIALNYREDFRTLCAAIRELQAENRHLTAVLTVAQCPGRCDDDCHLCSSGNWMLMCDECRSYLAQDAEPTR